MLKYSDWPEDRKIRARAAHRRWKDRNKEKRIKYWQKYDAARPLPEKLFRSMKGRTKDYNITADDILVSEKCPICDVAMIPSNIRGGSGYSPTLDKVIPELGYIKGNIVVICKFCNSLKGKGSAKEHRRIADYIDTYSPHTG